MNEPLMSRFRGITHDERTAHSWIDNMEVTGEWTLCYGFDTGGLLGADSPLYGYFIQAWFVHPEEGMRSMDPDYHQTGGKEVLIESPFWEDIVLRRPDHVKKIVLDLPIPEDTEETIAKIKEYWQEAGLN